ncbi:hypothetical protein [Actinoplanes philippinensis]|uniref:hypothetical protein n=1 Tax=Actinoplanes philippinensis TaxID=35752 RepID=UPI00340994AC
MTVGAGVALALGVLALPSPDEEPALVSRYLQPLTVTAGGTARFDLPLTNTGTTAAHGAVLVIDSPGVTTTYRNCSPVGDHLVCTFGTTLKAGAVYGLSAPLAFRAPADSITGSVLHAGVTWYTPAQYAANPVFVPKPGETYVWVATPPAALWGDAPELTLKEIVDPPADPPEDDPWDEFEPALEITVTDGRPADLTVTATRTPAAAGSGVVRVSLANHGPGRLYPDLYANNRPSIVMLFPKGTDSTTDVAGCYRFAGYRTVECDWADHLTVPVRVTDPEAGAGRVAIVSHSGRTLDLEDPDRANNAAPIVAG